MATTAHFATESSAPEPVVDKVAKAAHDAVDRAAAAAAPTAEWVGEQADSLKAAQRTVVDEACGYVSTHPIRSLGFAVAVGFILSRIMR